MSVIPLYRTYLRQVRALPHCYLRHFFRIKGIDDFRSVLETKSNQLRKRKLKRINRDLQRLRAANAGQSTAFDRVLDIAYGRVGKLRQELIEPLLSVSSLSPPTKKTCLPVYSSELAALLTSTISRTTRALPKQHLFSPPGLSHSPEDVLLLGPLSQRRGYNIRWRFFRSECKKIYPPFQVSPQHTTDHTETPILSKHALNFGFSALRELVVLASPPLRPAGLPVEQRRLQRTHQTPETNPFDGQLPARWLRRRYQALLARVPLLILRHNVNRTYDVQLADNAITTSGHPSRLRVADADDSPWISDIRPTVQSGMRRK